MQKRLHLSARARLGLALCVSSLSSLVLYILGTIYNKDALFWYMPWNLFLAWIPFLLAIYLDKLLYRRLWSNWYVLIVTLLWLLFLPNAFYLVSDLIHIQETGGGDLVYDVVLFASFVCNGLLLGFISLYMVHQQLRKRLVTASTTTIIGAILLLASFAIYIGRDLRWNSWDILINPASLLFDISERFIHIHQHPQLITTTLSFFLLLSTTYAIIWQATRLISKQR
jgi:uncharacterized membrane protein